MIKFYTNRELAEKLNINLAKWKRWSREFLPPDPLGGLQSGFARQYNFRSAFTVFLGGHFISALRYTVPESRQILEDLDAWLADNGFFSDKPMFSEDANVNSRVKTCQIFICPAVTLSPGGWRFRYFIRDIISNSHPESQDNSLREVRYRETTIPDNQKDSEMNAWDHAKVINISVIYSQFLSGLSSS